MPSVPSWARWLAYPSLPCRYDKESPFPFITSKIWSSVITACPAVVRRAHPPAFPMPNNDASKQQIRRRVGRWTRTGRNRRPTLRRSTATLSVPTKREAGMEIEYGKIRRPLFVFLKRRPFRLFFTAFRHASHLHISAQAPRSSLTHTRTALFHIHYDCRFG